MVSSSPLRRSALGSISSILNTTPKTATKHGRVGKSATPRSTGIRQKMLHLFNGNKENSPGKTGVPVWNGGESEEVCQCCGDCLHFQGPATWKGNSTYSLGGTGSNSHARCCERAGSTSRVRFC
jgi:hypothetical protein